jgi:hypothetical protein
MKASPRPNHVRYTAGSAIRSSSVSCSAGSNMPIAWSTPQQKVRRGVRKRGGHGSLPVQANAVTPSDQVSIFVRMASSSYEEMVTWLRVRFTKYISPLGSWHFRVAENVSFCDA